MGKRLDDRDLFQKNAATLLKEILVDAESGYLNLKGLADDVETIATLKIERHVIDKVIKNNDAAKEALEALDIDAEDQKQLSKIADYNQKGSVSMLELLNVLQRIR